MDACVCEGVVSRRDTSAIFHILFFDSILFYFFIFFISSCLVCTRCSGPRSVVEVAVVGGTLYAMVERSMFIFVSMILLRVRFSIS